MKVFATASAEVNFSRNYFFKIRNFFENFSVFVVKNGTNHEVILKNLIRFFRVIPAKAGIHRKARSEVSDQMPTRGWRDTFYDELDSSVISVNSSALPECFTISASSPKSACVKYFVNLSNFHGSKSRALWTSARALRVASSSSLNPDPSLESRHYLY